MLHKDYQINKVVHSISTTVQWLSEVLRLTRPSATLTNVVQEQNQSTKHVKISPIYSLSVIFLGKYRSTGNLKCLKLNKYFI